MVLLQMIRLRNVTGTVLEGLTPLHLAAMEGHTTVVALLLANGSDANATNEAGKTPLDLATNGGVRMLLKENGAIG